jgi:hypothetical protein
LATLRDFLLARATPFSSTGVCTAFFSGLEKSLIDWTA